MNYIHSGNPGFEALFIFNSTLKNSLAGIQIDKRIYLRVSICSSSTSTASKLQGMMFVRSFSKSNASFTAIFQKFSQQVICSNFAFHYYLCNPQVSYSAASLTEQSLFPMNFLCYSAIQLLTAKRRHQSALRAHCRNSWND